MKYIVLSFSLLLTILLSKESLSFGLPQAMDLKHSVAQSNIIFYAKLKKYTPDQKVQVKPSIPPKNTSEREMFMEQTLHTAAGDYQFEVIQTMKGNSRQTVNLKLTALYNFIYGGDIKAKTNSFFIVLLQEKQGVLTPTESLVPLIPVVEQNNLEQNATGVLHQITELMLGSLSDAQLKPIMFRLLRSVKDPAIPKALLPYIGDKDFRSDVLRSLAENQYVEAIPIIADSQQAEMAASGGGIGVISSLQNYKNPAAIPYLNPLLFSWEEYTRINTAMTLQDLSDSSSIPYLMLALFDPDEQNVVGYSAYRALHRLIPALGRPRDGGYFEVQRESETARVLRWWQDELGGKHLELTLPEAKPIGDFSTLPMEKLNVLLFDPSAELRQKAMAQLQTRAQNSSIPYLMLALYDPDQSVAYDAYAKLYQLIPKLKTAKDRASFVAHREAAIAPAFDWWQDELLGRHIQRLKTSQLPARSKQKHKTLASVPQKKSPRPLALLGALGAVSWLSLGLMS